MYHVLLGIHASLALKSVIFIHLKRTGLVHIDLKSDYKYEF